MEFKRFYPTLDVNRIGLWVRNGSIPTEDMTHQDMDHVSRVQRWFRKVYDGGAEAEELATYIRDRSEGVALSIPRTWVSVPRPSRGLKSKLDYFSPSDLRTAFDYAWLSMNHLRGYSSLTSQLATTSVSRGMTTYHGSNRHSGGSSTPRRNQGKGRAEPVSSDAPPPSAEASPSDEELWSIYMVTSPEISGDTPNADADAKSGPCEECDGQSTKNTWRVPRFEPYIYNSGATERVRDVVRRWSGVVSNDG